MEADVARPSLQDRAGGKGARSGRLLGIASRIAPKRPMIEHEASAIRVETGVADDFRGKPGRRQVTVLSRESWLAACADLGVEDLSWTSRRANLLVDRIDLQGKIGWELRVGDALLAITGETRPCQRMDQARTGLRRALEPSWRGGVTCRVIRSGSAAIGSSVALERNLARQAGRRVYFHVRSLLKKSRKLAGALARRTGLRPKRKHEAAL